MTTSLLAAYANRHPRFAAGLIIFSELTNAAIGLMLGSALLANQSGPSLSLVLIGLMGVRVAFQRYRSARLFDLPLGERFSFQKNSFAFLFLINFLAYGLAGGISGRAVLHPEPAVSVAGENFRSYAETSQKDTLITSSSTKPTRPSVAHSDEKPSAGTKIGYVLLFAVGVFLSFGAAGLACRLACANQGILAVFVILLGLGILAGGVYFLGRALTPDMKRYKDMTKAERKREGRRYFRILLATVGVTLASFLLGVLL